MNSGRSPNKVLRRLDNGSTKQQKNLIKENHFAQPLYRSSCANQSTDEATGSEKEAPLLRQLIDEALAVRRRKSVQRADAEPPPPTQDISETLQTLQTLMLRMIGQGESSFQMQSVSLELQQEAIVEARSGKMNVWEFLVAPGLSDKGKSTGEIAGLFDGQNEDAKDYAYGLAEEIKLDLDSDLDSDSAPSDEEDRQASFVYVPSDTSGNGGPTSIN